MHPRLSTVAVQVADACGHFVCLFVCLFVCSLQLEVERQHVAVFA
jgi:hypothetical protein